MLKNYIKLAFRNLIRDRSFSILNLVGLSVGLGSVIMIMAYVRYELSYDKSYSNYKQVYRLLQERKTGTIDETFVYTPLGLARALQKEFPDIKSFCSLGGRNIQFKYHNDIADCKVVEAEDDFFKLFNFPFITGDPNGALIAPGSMVVTTSFAKRYFANSNPIGKTITGNDGKLWHITGLINDLPANIHFSAEAIIKDDNPYTKQLLSPRNDFSAMTQYILADKSTNARHLENEFKSIYKKYDFPKDISIHLQPVTDIHLRSHYQGEIAPNSDIKYVYIFLSTALLILFIACINYINLTTARSLQRAKEIGLRKVLGAMRKQLIVQFLTESFLFFLVSTILSILITYTLWPVFSAKIISYQHVLPLFDSKLLLAVFAVFAASGLFAGAYPAFFLSSLQPVKILKGLAKFGVNISIRKALVVLQFTICGILIVSTIVIYQQLNYVRNARLGFDKDHLVSIPFYDTSSQSAFKNELLKSANIQSISVSSWQMGLRYGGWATIKNDRDSSKESRFEFIDTDPDFVKTMGLNLVSGRNFSATFSNDILSTRELYKKHLPSDDDDRVRMSKSVILNQEAVKVLGLTHPVGAILSKGPVKGTVIGVAENFNGLSLHQKILPVIIFCQLDNRHGSMYLRISPQNTHKALEFIADKWKNYYPNHRFEFSFTDEKLQQLYTADKRLGAIFGAFASLAIIIGCLGLFGLISLAVQNRVKEIGIRKVLGASVMNITRLISVDFIRLVIVSMAISSPIAWYGMNKWLRDFAYHISIQWWMFAAAGLLSVIIALATLSFQSIKAAMANPVKSLRSE